MKKALTTTILFTILSLSLFAQKSNTIVSTVGGKYNLVGESYFRNFKNFSVYVTYKGKLFPSNFPNVDYTLDVTSNVPWFDYKNQTLPVHNNSGIYQVGTWGNQELGRGIATYSSKKITSQILTTTNLFSVGIAKPVSKKVKLYGGVGMFKQVSKGSIKTTTQVSSYQMILAYDSWHVINGPSYRYISEYQISNTSDEVVKQINETTNNVNINLGIQYTIANVFVLGLDYDSNNKVSVSFGITF